MSPRSRWFLVAFLALSAIFLVGSAHGQTCWTVQTSPVGTDLTGVSFVDPNQGWICGKSGVILHTTDGGNSWVSQVSGTTQNLTEIEFGDANHGYASGGQGTILRTTNGGAAWVVVQVGAYDIPAATGLCVLNPATLWETYGQFSDYSAGAYVSTDSGVTWGGRSFSYNDGHPCYVLGNGVAGLNSHTAFDACTIRRYDGSTYPLVFCSTDGGNNWTPNFNPPGGDEEIRFLSDLVGFCGPGGSIARTLDGGTTWTTYSTGEYHHFSFLTANLGWIAGPAGAIARTTDGCATWDAQATGTSQDLLRIQFVTADVGTAVGAHGTILHTVTGGEMPSGVSRPRAGTVYLLSATPNPSAGAVRLAYSLPRSGEVHLAVFDLTGRLVRVLREGQMGASGETLRWDGRDQYGRAVPSGTFYVRLTGAEGAGQQAVTILR